MNYTTTQTIDNGETRTFGQDDTFSGITSSYAIHNGGTVTTDGVLFTANTCWSLVYNDGIIGVTNSVLTGNTISYGAVLDNFGGTASIIASTISDNGSAGIYSDPTALLNVTSSLISGNGYVGISSEGTASISASTISGHISSGLANGGDMTVTDCLICDNPGDQGGGINNSGTIIVSGSTICRNSAEWGGAIDNYTTFTLIDSLVEDNIGTKSGGAIYTFGGNIAVSGSTFSCNYAAGTYNDGGAIYAYSLDNVESPACLDISDSLFTGNSTQNDGGAIYLWGSGIVDVKASTFTDNESGQWGSGGAICHHSSYPPSGDSVLTVSDSIFSGNHSAHGAAISFSGDTVTIVDSVFSNNKSDDTGGAICTSGTVSISGSTFSGNTAEAFGGAIELTGLQATVSNCLITGNVAHDFDSHENFWYGSGGGIRTLCTTTIDGVTFSGNTAKNYGGGLDAVIATTISQSAFYDNVAEYGGGIWYAGTQSVKIGADLVFQGNTATGTGGGAGFQNNGDLEITGTRFLNNVAGGAGGLLIENYGLAAVTGATICGNTGFYGGGLRNFHSFNTTLTDTLFANNMTGNQGGAIDNDGDLDIIGCTFTGNTATGGYYGACGGAIHCGLNDRVSIDSSTFSGNKADGGGALYNSSHNFTTVTNSLIQDNTASDGAALFNNWGTISVSGAVIKNNTATMGGGALYTVNESTTTIANSEIIGNTAGETGGAFYNNNYEQLTIIGSTISTNSAGYAGGAGWNFGTVSLGDSIIDDNDAGLGAGAFCNFGTMSIGTSSFSGNTAEVFGGALGNLGDMSVSDVVFHDNAAAKGGALCNMGTLSVAGFYVYNGTATVSGSTFCENNADEGGAIYNSGVLEVSASTVSGNTATNGGGIFNGTTDFEYVLSAADFGYPDEMDLTLSFLGSGTMSINNAVISGNTATNGGGASNGGGAYNGNGGTMNVVGSTFTGNSVSQYGYGGAIYSRGTLYLTESVFSKNTAGQYGYGGAIYNLGYYYDGNSLVSDRCIFNENTAGDYGGAINNYGFATFTQGTFSSNTAKLGGAIYNSNSAKALISNNCTYSANTAKNYGGAVYTEGTASFAGDVFCGNSASTGGAIYNAKGNVIINGCTFATASDTIANGGLLTFMGTNILNSRLEGTYDTSRSGADGTVIKGAGTVTQTYAADGYETTFGAADSGMNIDATIIGGDRPSYIFGTFSTATFADDAKLHFINATMTATSSVYGAGVAAAGASYTTDSVAIDFAGTGMGAKALVCAGGKGAAGATIEVGTITVTSSASGDMGILYGGADLTNGGSFKATEITTTISGSGNYLSFVGNGCRNGNKSSGVVTTDIETSIVSISGGTFNNLVYGGAYAAGDYVSCGTANMTISGGTFNFSVYGGNGGKSTATTQNGKSVVGTVNVTIDVTGDNKVAFNRHISSGSFGDGTVSGDTHMTFTGDGANLSFGANSYVTGHSQNAYHIAGVAQTFVEGKSTLTFDSFTGEFKGSLSNGFTNVSISNDSNVILKGAAESDLRYTSVWDLAVGSDTDTLLDWSEATKAKNSFEGDTINLTLEEAFTGSKVLMNAGNDANLLTGWNSATVNLNGSTMSYDTNNKYYSDGSYKLYVDTTSGNKLMLASL